MFLLQLPLWRLESAEYGYACNTKHTRVTTLRVILGTSTLVAATRSRNGASFHLLSMLPSRDFQIALTVALYTEWQAVLTRPEYLLRGATAESALAFLRGPDDDMVLECAVASGSQYIVTHNIKDFRRAPELKVQAITPAQFLIILRRKPWPL